MLKSFEQLQLGLITPNRSQADFISHRLHEMDLSMHSNLMPCHSSGITTLNLDRVDERYLLSGAKNGDLAIHDLFNPKRRLSYNPAAICKIKKGHRFCITTAQWYPYDTGMFLTSSMDQMVKLWDTNALKPAETIPMDHKIAGLNMSTVSVKHSLIAVAMKYPHVVLLDPRSGSRCHELRGHKGGVTAVQWSPVSEYLLASGGEDNKIFFWDVRSAKGYLRSLDQHNGEAIGSKNDLITAHNGQVFSLKFTDDGFYLVSYGTDRRIRSWDVALAKNTLVNYKALPSVNPNFQISIDMCCDASLPAIFVPCNSDVYCYDFFSGYKFKTLQGHYDVVSSCAFRSLKQELFSCSNDKNILLWTPDAEREKAEEEFLSTQNKSVFKTKPAVDDASDDDSDDWSDDD